jgi:hypothetical protein
MQRVLATICAPLLPHCVLTTGRTWLTAMGALKSECPKGFECHWHAQRVTQPNGGKQTKTLTSKVMPAAVIWPGPYICP